VIIKLETFFCHGDVAYVVDIASASETADPGLNPAKAKV
jgi:hypothetical protein